MPSIKRTAQEESIDSPMSEILQPLMSGTYPMWVCGVNRKINTGNYENIDIYGGIGLPIMMVPSFEDLTPFKEAVAQAAELGFALASKETGDRYTLLKNLQGGGRK